MKLFYEFSRFYFVVTQLIPMVIFNFIFMSDCWMHLCFTDQRLFFVYNSFVRLSLDSLLSFFWRNFFSVWVKFKPVFGILNEFNKAKTNVILNIVLQLMIQIQMTEELRFTDYLWWKQKNIVTIKVVNVDPLWSWFMRQVSTRSYSQCPNLIPENAASLEQQQMRANCCGEERNCNVMVKVQIRKNKKTEFIIQLTDIP